MTQQRLHWIGLCLTWTLAIWPCWAQQDTTDEPDPGVLIHEQRTPEGVMLVVENTHLFDVTVGIRIASRNTQVVRYKTEIDAYKGKSQTQAFFISQKDPSKPWTWRYHWNWVKGNMHARHDDQVLYRLPFEERKSYRVTQSYHGKFSHQGVNAFSVDFAMREGTRICAARDGMVVDVEDQYTEGGTKDTYKDKSNFVTIAHADGTLGEYHHLKFQGVLVKLGQRVRAGDVIGLSGNTGYSSLPHLHFGVYSPKDSRTLQSHAVAFQTSQGVVKEPVVRRYYAVP